MQINALKLATQVREKLEEFYCQQLGFELLHQTQHSFTLKIGESTLEFEQDTNSYPTFVHYHVAFNIPENQLLEARVWLLSKGIKLLTFENQEIIDFPNWNAHALYFLDPAQNIIEFIARHDLLSHKKEPFEAKNIQNISEIGLPVPSIEKFYNFLHQFAKIPLYSAISNLKTFCAAGSAEGLFIIVPLERAWFPSAIINGIFPIEVTIMGDENKEIIFEDLPYVIKVVKN